MFGIFIAGLLKTHNLSFQDSESLQAVFDKNSCANVFRSQPRYVDYLNILCYGMLVLLCLSTCASGFPIEL